MDLIYADASFHDIGVLKGTEVDIAYGTSENDFSMEMSLRDHCLDKGYFLYYEKNEAGEVIPTEYGGIVDCIEVDSEKETVTYTGRTWTGIMNKKVVTPAPGEDYFVVSGDANEALQDLFENTGLDGLFAASTEESNVSLPVTFIRYQYLYEVIRSMLRNDLGKTIGKLKMECSNSMVICSIVPAVDYSEIEDFDASTDSFRLQKNYRPVNHMICMGQGDLRDRFIINLYTDEKGEIQQYLVDPSKGPLQDSDYIYGAGNVTHKVLTGHDEVIEVYDYPSAEITTNYVALSTQPADWKKVCEQYYSYDGQDYNKLEIEYVDNYVPYSSAPADWSTKYASYFVLVDGDYKNVEGVEQTSYVEKTKAQASDLHKNYGQYYYKYSDGNTTTYESLPTYTTYSYKKQTSQPSDWLLNWNQYYEIATGSKSYTLKPDAKIDGQKRTINWQKDYYKNQLKNTYASQGIVIDKTTCEKVSKNSKNYKLVIYYTLHQGYMSVVGSGKNKDKCPKWSAKKRYTRYSSDPKQYSYDYIKKYLGKVCRLEKTTVAPAFSGTVYALNGTKPVYPEFVPGATYQAVEDHFAVMIESAKEKILEFWAQDSLEINFSDSSQDIFDVGDYIGAADSVTGIVASHEVTKKIIKIKNGVLSISYETGGES